MFSTYTQFANPQEQLAAFIADERQKLEETLVAFQRGFDMCESPIEERFYVTWVTLFDRLHENWNQFEGWGVCTNWESRRLWMTLSPQQKLAFGDRNYRADFLVEIHSYDEHYRFRAPFRYIAIELDGHDFHERTKEQAKRDKSRDRMFVQNGITVLRFTGSEIYKDSMAAIADVQNTVERLAA